MTFSSFLRKLCVTQTNDKQTPKEEEKHWKKHTKNGVKQNLKHLICADFKRHHWYRNDLLNRDTWSQQQQQQQKQQLMHVLFCLLIVLFLQKQGKQWLCDNQRRRRRLTDRPDLYYHKLLTSENGSAKLGNDVWCGAVNLLVLMHGCCYCCCLVIGICGSGVWSQH